MKANFKVNNCAICSNDENILVFNYHYINEVQNIPCSSHSMFLQDEKRIGIWKIKKLNNYEKRN